MPNKTLNMKALRITALAILFLIACLSIWFYSKIKSLKEQITNTKSSSLTASNSPNKDLEKRIEDIEDCFEK